MPKRILIVDDERAVRVMLQDMLADQDYAVETAASGDEALLMNQEKPFDLLVTDIIMPGKEGIETMLEMREQSPGIKVIAISGGGHFGSAPYLHAAEKLGAQETLSKPFTRTELLDVIRSVLEGDS